MEVENVVIVMIRRRAMYLHANSSQHLSRRIKSKTWYDDCGRTVQVVFPVLGVLNIGVF